MEHIKELQQIEKELLSQLRQNLDKRTETTQNEMRRLKRIQKDVNLSREINGNVREHLFSVITDAEEKIQTIMKEALEALERARQELSIDSGTY